MTRTNSSRSVRYLTALAWIAAALFAASCGKTIKITDPAPATVSGLSPAQGAIGGGTAVTVYGSGFEPGAIVRFGSAWTPATFVSATELEAVSPPGAASGAVDVTVKSPDRAEGTLAGAFTYVRWWNSSWAKRRPVTVMGSTAGALTHYPVKITISFDPDMKSDFSDVRFTVYDGSTETQVPFWCENAEPAVSAVFWVTLPSIPASPSTVTVCVYFGNASAGCESDLDSTFPKDYPVTGLKGLWHMDEGTGGTAYDSSTQGNHAALRNFETPFGWTGTDGGIWGTVPVSYTEGDSISLDGRNSHLDAGGGSGVEARDAFTLEGWIKPDRDSNNGRLGSAGSRWEQADGAAFRDINRWSIFNARASTLSALGGYAGAAFDGKNVYFTPLISASSHGEVLKYDATKDFTDQASWEKFNPSATPRNPWTGALDMPTARTVTGQASVNGKMYVIGGLGATNLSTVEAYDIATNTWQTGLAPMPTARRALVCVAVNGIIYAIGGFDGTNRLKTVEAYDPVADTWTTGLADMPTARNSSGAAEVGGKIFVIGGEPFTSANEMYDPATDTWTVKTGVPTARHDPGCAAWGGKIYVMGGNTSGSGYTNTLRIYDVSTDTWANGLNMPYSIERQGAVAWKGRIYAFGGYYSSQARNHNLMYSPERNAWYVRDSMPTLRRNTAVAVVGDRIVCAGGYNGAPIQNTEIYDPGADFYQQTPSIAPRGYHGAVFDGTYVYFIPNNNGSDFGTVMRYDTRALFTAISSWDLFDPQWVFGGTDPNGFRGGVFDGRYLYLVPNYSGGYYGQMVRYDTKADFHDGQSWTFFDPGAAGVGVTPDGYHGAVFDGRYVYFVPLRNATTEHGEVMRYDTTAEFADANSWKAYDPDPGAHVYWTSKANMPSPVYVAASAVWNGLVYVFGGDTTGGTRVATVQEYNPILNTWRTRANMPSVIREPGAATFQDKIYVIGGINTTTHVNTVRIFDPAANTWTTGTAMPTARRGHGLLTVGNYIYAFGGYNGAYTAVNERYDPVADSWTPRFAMPQAKAFFGCAEAGGNIYAIGGNDGTVIVSTNYEYNPATNAWTTRAAAPVGRQSPGCASLGRMVFLSHGYDSTYQANGYRYDSANDIWNTAVMPASSYARNGVTSASVNGKVYVMGGFTGGNPFNYTEQFDPQDPSGFTGGAFDGRYVYFSKLSETQGDLLRYDTQRDFADKASWEIFTPALNGVGNNSTGFQGCFFDGRMVVFTPFRYAGNYHGEILAFDTTRPFSEAASWTAFDPGTASFDGLGFDPDGFVGGLSDGRYSYIVPFNDGAAGSGQVLRFDAAGTGSAYRLDWSRPGMDGGYSGAPPGPAATLITENGTFRVCSGKPLAGGKWRHIAVSYDGAALSLYVDGALESTTAATGRLPSTSVPLRLGALAGGGTGSLAGAVDEVRLYSRGLSAAEVKAASERRPYASPEPAVGAVGAEESR